MSSVGIQNHNLFICIYHIFIYIYIYIYSGRIQCAQLQDVRFGFQKATRTTYCRYRKTEIQRDREIYKEKKTHTQTHTRNFYWTPQGTSRPFFRGEKHIDDCYLSKILLKRLLWESPKKLNIWHLTMLKASTEPSLYCLQLDMYTSMKSIGPSLITYF